MKAVFGLDPKLNLLMRLKQNVLDIKVNGTIFTNAAFNFLKDMGKLTQMRGKSVLASLISPEEKKKHLKPAGKTSYNQKTSLGWHKSRLIGHTHTGKS